MDISFILLIAFICLAIGFFTSRLLSSLADAPQADIPEDDKGVVKVWHDKESGGLRVGIGGQSYGKMIDLSSRERYKVQQILLQLDQWLTPEIAKNLGETPIDESKELSFGIEIPGEGKPRTSYNPLSMIADAIRADVPKVPPPDVNLVAQIDAILQTKLKNKDTAVRLMDWPGQGMVVMIGLEKYNQVDDVPDAEIKALIRSAVKEWEQQQVLEQER